MHLVSVIIPCFNAERFIDATIASVDQQTGVDWELIVVDDGSSDGSLKVIKAWQHRLGIRMKLHSGPNRGVSAARNTGTAMAHGDFLQYLDADDLLRPGTLQRRVAALAAGGDVVYCDWQKLVEQPDGGFSAGEIIARCIEDMHQRAEIALLTKFWAPPAALLYSRQIVDEIGGWNESLPVIQDARFALDAAIAGARFVHLPEVGADYRVLRGTSLSSSNPLRFVRDCFHNACQIEDYWRAHGGLDDDRRAALIACYDFTARTLLQLDYPAFKRNLERLYGVEPGFRSSYPKVGGLLAKWIGQQRAVRCMQGALSLRHSDRLITSENTR
jgi:glycosyltransferase involved in cell wall biosynthesis